MEIHEYLEKEHIDKIYMLIIYDIKSDLNRTKFSKVLEGYGFRVQKSAFEAYLTPHKYEKLLKMIPKLIDKDVDSVRLYRLHGDGKIILFLNNIKIKSDDLIIV